MQSDPVVDEIRKLRELRAAKFDFDIRAIVKDARQRDACGERRIVRLPPRPVVTSSTGKATTS